MRVWLPLLFLAVRLQGAGLEVAFDAANKLSEEGKHAEAVEAYQKLLDEGHHSAAILYNLGNASYKAGLMGRAIVAYREAEQLIPRDAGLRANLEFVRRKVNGEDRVVVPGWRAWLGLLTLNEGSLLATGALWLWFLLLAARQWRHDWGKALSGYTAAAGALVVVTVGCLAASASLRLGENAAVVVVKQAVVRFGPLDESQTAFQLPDGAEVTVLDTKDRWFQIRDLSNRTGWLKQDQVLRLGLPRSPQTDPSKK